MLLTLGSRMSSQVVKSILTVDFHIACSNGILTTIKPLIY